MHVILKALFNEYICAPMLQKITACIILFMLLFGMGGHLILFKLERTAIRREIKERLEHSIPKEELCLIRFSTDKKIDWKRKDKEFRYLGDMYDVVYKEYHAGVIHYYCIKDKEETKLLANLEKLVKEHTGKTKQGKTAKNLLKVFLSLSYFPPGQITIALCFSGGAVRKTEYSDQEISFVQDTHTPPPKRG